MRWSTPVIAVGKKAMATDRGATVFVRVDVKAIASTLEVILQHPEA
jgi:hypothetical protein